MTRVVTYIEIDVPDFVGSSPELLTTYRFVKPADYLDQSIDAIPILEAVSFNAQSISLGKNLGQRASLNVTLNDCKYSFDGESVESGSFWGKWRARYGQTLRSRNIRIIRGTVGQALSEMDTRHYIIESTNGPSLHGKYAIAAKDILKLADDDRAQAPLVSTGELASPITNAATSATLAPTGIGDDAYPASGWVCIGGKEVCSFTRSGDTLTLTRAQFGTTAVAHDDADRVQIVLRYAGNTAADIINDLLTNYTETPAEYIPFTEWEAEMSSFLSVNYARTIVEPTSVRTMINELIEQAALAMYWDDEAQRIRLKVLRQISTDTDRIDETQIFDGSLTINEQPDKRISRVWTFFGQRDPTDTGAKEDNFRAVKVDLDLDKEAEYDSKQIVKLQAAWIETETAASRHNGIQLSRFKDPPRRFGFDLLRTASVTPAAGYILTWPGEQTVLGDQADIPIQITQVTVHADRVHIEAEEMLASGVITLINVVFLTTTGSVLTWDVPEDWNNDDNAVYCIGAGAGAGNPGTVGGKGGGGGACSFSLNLMLSASPGGSIQYRVGAGGGVETDGGDTWFDGATFGAASVAAEGGDGGSGQLGGGGGGQASNGIGDTRYSGGDGGNGSARDSSTERAAGGGGGGAAGPNGDGANGGAGEQTGSGHNATAGGGGGGADGGTAGNQGGDPDAKNGGPGGDNRFEFGGGSEGQSGEQGGGGGGGNYLSGLAGGPGGTGEQLFTQTVTPIISAGPGGGGGGGARNQNGGDGGLYGAGGGGRGSGGSSSGVGADGIIVITWRVATS